MPEAAVYEYGSLKTRQYYIRLARKVLSVEAETVPTDMEIRAHNSLRRGIAGSNPRHDPASFIRGKRIRHNSIPPSSSHPWSKIDG